jgi:hypothetical protein
VEDARYERTAVIVRYREIERGDRTEVRRAERDRSIAPSNHSVTVARLASAASNR